MLALMRIPDITGERGLKRAGWEPASILMDFDARRKLRQAVSLIGKGLKFVSGINLERSINFEKGNTGF